MKVQLISHASLVIEINGIRILCDPWLQGKVFNDSWALCPAPHPVDFSSIHYIWISHEHPDHLHFPTLKSIPSEFKNKITLLHQKHASTRVIDSLRPLGFREIIELPIYEWFKLHPDSPSSLYCGSIGVMDSFLAVRDQTGCILNLNDCVINQSQASYIKRQVGDISVLFTQFSIAGWVGNESDEMRQGARKIQDLKMQIRVFSPGVTVPFASFVYYCNQENHRMNAWMNTPEIIHKLHLNTVKFMYPGEVWDTEAPSINNDSATVNKLMEQLNKMKIDPSPQPVEPALICKSIPKALGRLKAKVPRFLLRKLRSFCIYLHDLEKILVIEPADGKFKIIDATDDLAQKARYVMCSQVAWIMFKYEWGCGTVAGSGMFLDREYLTQGINPFFRYSLYISTKVLSPKSFRGLVFLWKKKWELFYRFFGRGHTQADTPPDYAEIM